eukprot:CAMPEP_0194763904 /NCGR_PEP_ID=MMETSP0323_2-20130528/20715_1 /TAXON_ID=2866 ORGANISM="Crypthecodinium cohnii, Strain Seligo" /NCGR_SAMPLE_ID=MMETSP0323_2 /ASSEMBLY_ACC=CAM_ASM_000346 /LENGTH=104 /DNA_ID=CAMNT_0039689841 /DNA_START=504 /DNA_END=815 /DNA_ORIENTATION=-
MHEICTEEFGLEEEEEEGAQGCASHYSAKSLPSLALPFAELPRLAVTLDIASKHPTFARFTTSYVRDVTPNSDADAVSVTISATINLVVRMANAVKQAWPPKKK